VKINVRKDGKIMDEMFNRSSLLLGEDGIEKLNKSHVWVFGIGGVGGYTCEALARTGVGTIDLVDSDTVALSNINRQIIALQSTVGKYKTEVMRDRIKDINPKIQVNLFTEFFTKEMIEEFDFTGYDYIVDAIDSVASKVLLIEYAKMAGVPIISSMGTGNKLDPTGFMVSDISKTEVCPLARAVRTRLRKIGINHLKVVYSKELPAAPSADGERIVPASVSFVPGVAGMIMAGEVIKDLSGVREKQNP
jgi:tRNA A37 threonylcarbamoyladenosine dehydratase